MICCLLAVIDLHEPGGMFCRGSLFRLLHRPNRELDERRRVRMALDVVCAGAQGPDYSLRLFWHLMVMVGTHPVTFRSCAG